MKKSAILWFLLLSTLLFGCQVQQTSPLPTVENNKELTPEIVKALPYTYYGENNCWKITLTVKEDISEKAQLLRESTGDEHIYISQLFVQAKEKALQQIQSGEISEIAVMIPREDGLAFTGTLKAGQLEDDNANNRTAAQQMLAGETPWVIGENSTHYSSGLMMPKAESYTATVATLPPDGEEEDISYAKIPMTLVPQQRLDS